MTFLMQGWRTDKLNYSGEAAAVIAQGTYGFMNPRRSLYDAFVATEGTDGYRLKSIMRTSEQMEEFGITLQTGASWVGHEGLYM